MNSFNHTSKGIVSGSTDSRTKGHLDLQSCYLSEIFLPDGR